MKIARSNIEEAVNKIIELTGLGGLPAVEENIFRDNLEAQLERRIGIIIMQGLNEEGLEAYDELTAGSMDPDPEELERLLKKYLPDYQNLIQEGLEEFVNEALSAAY